MQHEFFARLVSRNHQLVFNGGVVYDAKDSRTHSIKCYGDRTEFLFIVKGVEGDSIADHAVDVLKTRGVATVACVTLPFAITFLIIKVSETD